MSETLHLETLFKIQCLKSLFEVSSPPTSRQFHYIKLRLTDIVPQTMIYDMTGRPEYYCHLHVSDPIDIPPSCKFPGAQEFKDPVNEGFRNYLEIDKLDLEEPVEDGDSYLEKVKADRKKVGKMYFDSPLDHLTIKGKILLEGKSIYQVDYCDIEEDIRNKLSHESKVKYSLPKGWQIPLTTHHCDFRDPVILSDQALASPKMIKPVGNLGQNEMINEILNVRTGDSEYNGSIGKLGDFIVENQMHGKIDHPNCSCVKHNR